MSSCTCRSSRWCIYSFNDSPIPNLWRGFTLKWYAALPNDRDDRRPLAQPEDAFFTASGSVLLGTLAAFALVKYKRFTGRTAFSGMVNAPLVMPEVIIGLSLLLMLVSVQRVLGFPERGMRPSGSATCCWAWPTPRWWSRRACRISTRSSRRRRWTWAPAAPRVFYLVTLPMIAQSMLSAWLLTFTLSLDDVVLSAFLSGPGATTMPLVIFSRTPGPEPERQRGGHHHRAGGRRRGGWRASPSPAPNDAAASELAAAARRMTRPIRNRPRND